jgi:hypothetical protein
MKNDRILPPGQVLPPMNAGQGAPTHGDKASHFVGDAASAKGLGGRYPKPLSRGSRRPSEKVPGKLDRFKVLNDFVDIAMRELSDSALRAWFVLYRDTKPNGLAKTGLTDLARRAGFSHSTAKRAVRELIGRGLAEPVLRGRKGTGPSTYRVAGVGNTSAANR